MTSELIILGSSNAVPAPGHTNTHFAFITPNHRLLVDCGSNPVVSLAQAGLDVNIITELILTHFHPDHVSSLPLLLMNMWLKGRRQPLDIYGLEYTLDHAKAMMELYTWGDWPGMFPVHFHPIPYTDRALLLENESMRIFASPVKHFLPTICLRVELKPEGKIVAYSCDSEPCAAIVDIARGADILLHEASGALPGHSSAAQAGESAQEAGAKALYLIHYPTERLRDDSLAAEARAEFTGQVVQAVDLMKIELSSK